MQREKIKKRNKKSIKERRRRRIFTGAVIAGLLILIGAGLAWYSLRQRNAETEPENVMKPYNLTLMNASGTDVLQLSVGSLMLGETKQIVFCVSNDDAGDYAFDYMLELIHTDNLALDYTIYALEESDEENATIIAEDTIIVDGESEQIFTYWKVNSEGIALVGDDVSSERHQETGLTGDEINSGTYILYQNEESNTNNLYLTTGEDGDSAQYFLMEIEWNEGAYTNYEGYEKETDMIYLLVKAVQPEPQK